MSSISFTNLRVFIDDSVHKIYTGLTEKSLEKAEEAPFIKMPDLFLTAACVGAKEKRFIELKKKRDIFVADAFDSRTQIPILITLAYKWTQDLDVLTDSRKILSICEGWANGGITLVYDQVMSSGKGLRPLYKFTDFIFEEMKR